MANVGAEMLIPHMRDLLKTIQGLEKSTGMTRATRIDETRRLLTINSLMKCVVKKDILDVQLMDQPITGNGEAEDHSDSRRLDDRIEGLIVINTRLLRIPANDRESFVARKSAIRMEFVFKNLLS